jgi:hypothetical protein
MRIELSDFRHAAATAFKVGEKLPFLLMAGAFARSAKNGRRMYRSHQVRCKRGINQLATMLGYAEVSAQQGLRRGCAETHDYFRFQRGDFRVEPEPAAFISLAFGVLWMRRFPRGAHLKCFTTFVRYACFKSIPASFSVVCKSLPAGRTKASLVDLPDRPVLPRPL